MLDETQKREVRRFAGYPVLSDVMTDNHHAFEAALDSLSFDDTDLLVSAYLTPLKDFENALVAASRKMGVESIDGVMKRDTEEHVKRRAVINSFAEQMCGFLGVSPGPNLSSSRARTVKWER